MIITIDGPAASGKSSVAREIAKQLGIPYVSSGLLYRAIAFLALENGGEAMVFQDSLRLIPDSSGNRVLIGEREITNELNSTLVDSFVSSVAQKQEVRAFVNNELSKLTGSFVAEGRDMGSVVFPNAKLKIYLVASPKIRAKRRLAERFSPETEKALIERDISDASNLKPAIDAKIIDTSELDLDQVVKQIMTLVNDGPKL